MSVRNSSSTLSTWNSAKQETTETVNFEHNFMENFVSIKYGRKEEKLPLKIKLQNVRDPEMMVILKGKVNPRVVGKNRQISYTVNLKKDDSITELPDAEVSIIEYTDKVFIEILQLSDARDYSLWAKGIRTTIFMALAHYARDVKKGLEMVTDDFGIAELFHNYVSPRTVFKSQDEFHESFISQSLHDMLKRFEHVTIAVQGNDFVWKGDFNFEIFDGTAQDVFDYRTGTGRYFSDIAGHEITLDSHESPDTFGKNIHLFIPKREGRATFSPPLPFKYYIHLPTQILIFAPHGKIYKEFPIPRLKQEEQIDHTKKYFSAA